jgi:hypothetical protein
VFLKSLCATVRDTAPRRASSLNVEADQVIVSFDTASALRLIVADLIANSYKHAFPAIAKAPSRSGSRRWAPAGPWRPPTMALPKGFDPNDSSGSVCG